MAIYFPNNVALIRLRVAYPWHKIYSAHGQGQLNAPRCKLATLLGVGDSSYPTVRDSWLICFQGLRLPLQ